MDFYIARQPIFNTKKRLFRTPGLGSAVINLDDEYGRELAKEVREHVCVWGYSLKEDISAYKEYADYFVHALEIKPFERGCHLSVATPKGEAKFDIPLVGRFNVANALATLSTLLVSHLSFDDAVKSLAGVRPVDGRVEIISEDDKPVVVVDYAHTEQGLEAVCQSVRDHFSGDMWCVFGCGGDRDRSKRALMAKVAEKYANKIIKKEDIEKKLLEFKNQQLIF